MKKLRYFIISLICFTMGGNALVSCVDEFNVGNSFLEKAPGVDVTLDTIFSKAENTRYFLWNLYNHMSCPFFVKVQMHESPN